MRIGIETECLNHPITGVQLATLELIKGLLQQHKKIVCFHTKNPIHPKIEKAEHYLFRTPPSLPLMKSCFSAFHSSCFECVDIVHFSAPRLSYLKRPKVPLVLTIHDIGPLVHPHFYGKKSHYFYKYILPKYLNDMDAIITSSHFNKAEILKFYPLKEKNIHVIPFALSDPPRPMVKNKEPILLFIGTPHIRKNVKAVLDAFALLRAEEFPYRLVLLGDPLAQNQLSSWNQNEKLKGWVIDEGFVSETKKKQWLQKASLLIMPSFYEGFGFPLLEALCAGIPIIGSNLASLPEVIGPGGILINPHDPQNIASAIKLALSSSEKYETLVQKSLKQASQFSYEKMIQDTISVYQKILDKV